MTFSLPSLFAFALYLLCSPLKDYMETKIFCCFGFAVIFSLWQIRVMQTDCISIGWLRMLHCISKANVEIVNNNWTRWSEISWFVSGEQSANNGSACHWQIKIFCNNWVCFIIRSPNLFFNECLREAKWSAIVTQISFTHEENIFIYLFYFIIFAYDMIQRGKK